MAHFEHNNHFTLIIASKAENVQSFSICQWRPLAVRQEKSIQGFKNYVDYVMIIFDKNLRLAGNSGLEAGNIKSSFSKPVLEIRQQTTAVQSGHFDMYMQA